MQLKHIKILILFLVLPVKSWSQSDFKVIFDDEPVVRVHDTAIVQATTPAIIVTDSIRASLVTNARKYIGVRYHYSQSNENGFDCSGYVKYVYGNFGYSLPRSSCDQYEKSRHLRAMEALPGDLVFFITRGKKISHVGIYLGNNEFIHSPGKGKTVSISSLDEIYFKKHLAGFGSYLGPSDLSR
jgi:cell wall-associated NlpC family hydrolase